MKAADIAGVLSDFSRLCGGKNDANAVKSLVELLHAGGTQQTKAVLEQVAREPVTPAKSPFEALGQAVACLVKFQEFSAKHLKKAIADDIQLVAEFAERNHAADFASLKLVSSAPKSVKKAKVSAEGSAAADALVASYLKKLDETFGFEPDFHNVFSELKADPLMKAPQLKKLAKQFAHSSASSADDALRSIFQRHLNIIKGDRHRAAVGGRVS